MRWLAVLLVVLLSGCSLPSTPGSIEQQINEEIGRPGTTILAGPDIRLIKQTPVGTAVLYTYQSEQDGQKIQWSSINFCERKGTGWMCKGSSGSGTEIGQAPAPIEFGIGASLMDQEYAYVSGLVADPAITRVAVTFDDDTREVVPVENGAYVAVRQGIAGVTKIEALDANGTVIHQQAGN